MYNNIALNIHIQMLNHENDTYVFESVCELLHASFLNFTIENNEKTENKKKILYFDYLSWNYNDVCT